MMNWYKEEYCFKITVVSVGGDGSAQRCRNGHEPGDTYTCGYGCPMPQNGEGGFCSKSVSKLFPLLEAVRTGGDLSYLLAGASRYSGRFTCPDGVVTFRLDAYKKRDIKPEPISESNRQKVTEFIAEHWFGTEMVIRGKIIDMTRVDGFVILNGGVILGLITYLMKDGICEITSLDSLISNSGNGTMLVDSVINTAKRNRCRRIQLITTNDNINAIRFYQKRGFELAGVNCGAIDREREIKPQIPLTGQNGIPLRHEIEFAMEL